MVKPLVEAPADDPGHAYETLGYLDAYDAPLNIDYAFVAYKETDRDTGAWRIRIKSSQTAGAVFEPEAIRLKARETGAHNKPFFPWGYSFDPSPSDPRHIEFRVHVKDGRAASIEMFTRLRKGDGSPDEPRSVSFPWPA